MDRLRKRVKIALSGPQVGPNCKRRSSGNSSGDIQSWQSISGGAPRIWKAFKVERRWNVAGTRRRSEECSSPGPLNVWKRTLSVDSWGRASFSTSRMKMGSVSREREKTLSESEAWKISQGTEPIYPVSISPYDKVFGSAVGAEGTLTFHSDNRLRPFGR